MFRVNKEFFYDTSNISIKHNNPNVKYVKVKEFNSFYKDIDNSKKIVYVFFEDDIINLNNRYTNKIEIFEDDFIKWFDFQVVTFCYSGNNLGDNFDEQKCHHGDLLFYVPLNWLIDTINSDKSLISTRECNFDKISGLEDFLVWNDTYTHSEGERIFSKAMDEKVISSKPCITNCDYCESNNIFRLC